MTQMTKAVVDQKPNTFKELVQAGLAERMDSKLAELRGKVGARLFKAESEDFERDEKADKKISKDGDAPAKEKDTKKSEKNSQPKKDGDKMKSEMDANGGYEKTPSETTSKNPTNGDKVDTEFSMQMQNHLAHLVGNDYKDIMVAGKPFAPSIEEVMKNGNAEDITKAVLAMNSMTDIAAYVKSQKMKG